MKKILLILLLVLIFLPCLSSAENKVIINKYGLKEIWNDAFGWWEKIHNQIEKKSESFLKEWWKIIKREFQKELKEMKEDLKNKIDSVIGNINLWDKLKGLIKSLL